MKNSEYYRHVRFVGEFTQEEMDRIADVIEKREGGAFGAYYNTCEFWHWDQTSRWGFRRMTWTYAPHWEETLDALLNWYNTDYMKPILREE